MATTRFVFGRSRSVEAPVKSETSSRLDAGTILFGLWIGVIAVVVLGGFIALFLG